MPAAPVRLIYAGRVVLLGRARRSVEGAVRVAVASIALLAVGCSDEPVAVPTTSASSSAGVGVGGAGGEGALGGAGGAGGAGGSGGIAVRATSGTLELGFSIAAQGSGTAEVGPIEIAGAVGTIVIDGETLRAVAYERQPFDPYVLYQLLVVDDDRLFVAWLYCQDSELVHLYWEGTDGTVLSQEAATGSCDGTTVASTADVELPAVTMEYPALLTGYTLDGPEIQLGFAGPGKLDLGGGDLVVLPFEDVDCSACGGPGWFEIHTLLWDPERARLCFAIFYLFQPGDPVLLTYSLTLPDLTDPAGETMLNATWTAP